MKLIFRTLLIYVSLAFLAFNINGSSKRSKLRPPNLVFVFSDQQSWDQLGCYGNEQLITPNLDKLASEGIRFNHCISSSPLCTPFRGMLLSGQHPLFNGAMENDVRMLPGEGNYFAEVLRNARYHTGYYGKWHLYGGNRNRPVPEASHRYGFDNEFVTNNCTVLYDTKRSYYWDGKNEKRLYGEWESDAQTRQAMDFVDKYADKPFALFLSWHPPHNWASGDPNTYLAPREFMEMYNPDSIKLRPNVVDNDSIRKCYQGHMAMITCIDRAFGWLMDKLREQGLADNTIVVFTSDHGDAVGSHGNPTNKLRPELESIRVPLIIRFPGVLQTRVSDLLVGALDLMPTILGLMGVEAPATCQGKDLSNAIVQSDDDAQESVPLFCLPMDWRGIYTRRYTYAMDVSQGEQTQYRDWLFKNRESMFHRPLNYNVLFDRENDAWEMNNLYSSSQDQEVREKLYKHTRQWMDKFGDTGLPYIRIAEKTKTPEDMKAWLSRKFEEVEGELIGRPVDLLKNQSDTFNR